MRRYWKLAVGLLTLCVLVYAMALAVEPPQIEGPGLRVNSHGYMYKPLVGAGSASSATTWSVDSALTDTSEAYKIIPGSYVSISMTLGATTDTLDDIYIYASNTGSPADWFLIDSIPLINGEDGLSHLRYVHGPSSASGGVGAVTPVIARYIHVVVANHDGANASAATVISGRVVTSTATGP